MCRKVPKLSVIMCAYEYTPYIKDAIESVLSQTFSDFEFLIGLDSHQKNLPDVVKSICGDDERVKIYVISIPQLLFSLNYLINFSNAEYLVRMDADDICVPTRFEELVKVIEDRQPDIIGSWAKIIDQNGVAFDAFEPPTEQKAIEKRMLYATALYHPTVAIKKSFFLSIKGYAGGLYSEDYDLWLRSVRAGARIYNIPKHLLMYRVHPGQASGSKNGRAEVASHQLRELILKPSFHRAFAFFVALSKAVFGPNVTSFGRTFFGFTNHIIAKQRSKS